MIQKRSRIKINTNLAKIRQAGKNPQEVQKELLEFFEKEDLSMKSMLDICIRKRLRGRKRSRLRMN